MSALNQNGFKSPDSEPGVVFNCHACGECCSSWTIPIEASKAKSLLQKQWVQDRLALFQKELTWVSQEMAHIPHTSQNTCVFLADNGHCLIEAHEGKALKPSECIRFPFASVRMPDGAIENDTSAACKHISEVLLKAFAPIQPNDQQQILSASSVPPSVDVETLPLEIYQSMFKKISMQQYQDAWLPSVQAVLSDASYSLEEAFQQLLSTLRPAKTKARSFILQRLLKQVLLLTFIRKPYDSWTLWDWIASGRYQDQKIFGVPIDLKLVKKVSAQTEQAEVLLKGFIYQLLTRKRLLTRGASLKGLMAMAWIAILLAQWYASVLASFRIDMMDSTQMTECSESVTEQDMANAIRLVERYYTGHQPKFLQFFASRWRGEALFALMGETRDWR